MTVDTPRRRELLGLGLLLPLAGPSARAFAADSTPEAGPEAGAFETTSVDAMTLTDPERGRRIATRAYYPTRPGSYPLIVFSHGFGGSLVTFANTGRIWASHGYVVLHPTHSDSLAMPDPAIDPAQSAVMRKYREQRGAVDAATRTAFVKLLDDPFFLASRLRDVGFLQRSLKAGTGLDKAVLDRADLAKMGMSGHSFGAYTTLVIGGAALSPPSPAPIPTGFLGFLSMSGQGPGRMSLNDDSFRTMTKPLMATTGTRDFGAAGETPPWRLKPYDLSPPGGKYAVVVEGFAHNEFDPAPGDPLQGARGAELRRLQLRFWAGVLRGERDELAALDRQAAASKASDPVWLRKR